MAKMALVKVECKKCGRLLIEAPKGARVMCPRCGKWTPAK